MKTIPKRVRLNVWGKYDHKCAYCGKKIDYTEMQVDHIVPKRRGYDDEYLSEVGIKRGEDTIENYLPACRKCNLRKGMESIEDFRYELRYQAERAIKNYSQVKQSLDYGLFVYNEQPLIFYFEKCDAKNKVEELNRMIGKKLVDLQEKDIVHIVHTDIVELERFEVQQRSKVGSKLTFKLSSLERSKELCFEIDVWFEYSDILSKNKIDGDIWICSDRENAKMRFIESWFAKNSHLKQCQEETVID